MAGEEGFLGRWSRLKRAGAQTPMRAEGEPSPSLDLSQQQEPVEKQEDPPSLPDIATLTKESDFTPFMRPQVEDDLRQEALRKLWRTDPVFAEHDGLTDYADDFRHQPGIVVRTAYNVGRGYLEELVDTAEGAVPDAEPQEAGADQPEGEEG